MTGSGDDEAREHSEPMPDGIRTFGALPVVQCWCMPKDTIVIGLIKCQWPDCANGRQSDPSASGQDGRPRRLEPPTDTA